MIAQIPVVKFADNEAQSILTNRLYHFCMSYILRRVKRYSHKPRIMSDPSGNLRNVRTIISGYLADYPEQSMICGLAASQAPASTATSNQFGDADCHPLRKGKMTLAKISKLMEDYGPDDDLVSFEKNAKKLGLNGVVEPFWEDWKFADPCEFLAPDALHAWHKFWQDHVWSWGCKLLGNQEIDRRLSVLQPRVGFHHFKQGVTRFKQHTGRETRDLQRVFLGIIADHPSVTPSIMRAFRAIMDYIYIGQYQSHSEGTLKYLENALKDFHDNKQSLSDAGLRDGKRRQGRFNIPKLEQMQHPPRLIRLLGSADQFTTDVTERCHKTEAKEPYKATNKKEFQSQMCRYSDREEKLHLFHSYLLWAAPTELAVDIGDSTTRTAKAHDFDPTDPQLFPVQYLRTASGFCSRPIRHQFGNVLGNSTTAFHLNEIASLKAQNIDDIATRYRIPDFCMAVDKAKSMLKTRYDCWFKFRLQLNAIHDDTLFLPPLTVQALPPDANMPFGRCNFVLARKNEDTRNMYGIQGKYVIAKEKLTMFTICF